jgi:hypothetical protein
VFLYIDPTLISDSSFVKSITIKITGKCAVYLGPLYIRILWKGPAVRHSAIANLSVLITAMDLYHALQPGYPGCSYINRS